MDIIYKILVFIFGAMFGASYCRIIGFPKASEFIALIFINIAILVVYDASIFFYVLSVSMGFVVAVALSD